MRGVTRRKSDDSTEMSFNWMGCASEKEKYLCKKEERYCSRSKGMEHKESGPYL